ncbi:MAG TPA: NUDIX hydrolase, partial [Candidatus Saccharimonadia bacterium]|nr:NUDIX hydrolase [Candidatus Saccharimonadia bacterium]
MKDRSQPMWHGSDASEVKATESKLDNPDNLRRIYRTIASAVIFSRDTKLLMGRKDPKKGGVYSDIWHITGGGVEDAETVDDAVVREISQEVRGLDISRRERLLLPWVGSGGAAKTLPTREHV